MKRGMVLLWAGLMVLSGALFGFGSEKAVKFGISQIVEHPALDATRKGFIDQLEEQGYKSGSRAEYLYKNAQNNRAVSGQIARHLVGEKVDLILAISTPSAQDAAAATQEIPILF
ncbi:MAG: hypothetical protein LDL33_12595, partial [Desulfomonile sp.]|nr:hypothetical protein [Desulfomonile sp.]